MRILINCSGAKFGGGKTIVETYVHWISERDSRNEYIFIAGFANEQDIPPNVRWIKKTTSGLATFLYAILFIYFDIRRFSPDVVLSFSNVNFIFSTVRRVTYFHQRLLFEKKIDKTFLFRLVIKHFLKNTKFIVQSEFIKQLFWSEFGLGTKVTALWPGFLVPAAKQTVALEGIIKKHAGKKILVCPYVSVGTAYKNFQILLSAQDALAAKNIVVLVTASRHECVGSEVFDFIGPLSREELFGLYMSVDGMIYPSTRETLGLPIFEFAETGKPVLVYERPYLDPYLKKFNKPLNIISFNEDTFIESLNKISKEFTVSPCEKYRRGEWEYLSVYT